MASKLVQLYIVAMNPDVYVDGIVVLPITGVETAKTIKVHGPHVSRAGGHVLRKTGVDKFDGSVRDKTWLVSRTYEGACDKMRAQLERDQRIAEENLAKAKRRLSQLDKLYTEGD